MNAHSYAPFAQPVYKSSTKRLAEPFVQDVQEVFKQLELLRPRCGETPPRGPSSATVMWAKEILLRVLPRKFLIGAVVSAFEQEIHVTWENEQNGKSVVVFFPAPQQLKIYWEKVTGDKVEEHKLVDATTGVDVSEKLRWFFSID